MSRQVFVSALTLSFFLAAVFPIVSSEVNPCRFDMDYCHCKQGTAPEGTCFDEIPGGSPSDILCESRPCAQGWSCSCSERTHLCPVRDFSALRLDSFLPGSTTQAYCTAVSAQGASAQELELGGWTIGLSQSGLEQNECVKMTWFVNGVEMGSYDGSTPVTPATVAAQLMDRGTHTMYEFKSGDLLSILLQASSYHCLTSMFTLNVDGVMMTVDNSDDGSIIRYARKYTAGWNEQSFVPVLGTSELSSPAEAFVPLRSSFFSSGAPIMPGVDYWIAPDGSRDHAKGNYYVRIQL